MKISRHGEGLTWRDARIYASDYYRHKARMFRHRTFQVGIRALRCKEAHTDIWALDWCLFDTACSRDTNGISMLRCMTIRACHYSNVMNHDHSESISRSAILVDFVQQHTEAAARTLIRTAAFCEL